MHMTPDVLIVGGGIVGLACAEALAARGLDCRVVDRGEIGGSGWQAASWASAGMIAPLAEVAVETPVPDADRFLDVCLRSRDLWARWALALEDATGLDLDYDRSGALLVADEGNDPGRLDRFEAAARRAGEPADRLSPQQVRRLVPDAAPGLDFGLRLAGEHRVDNRQVCLALLRRLRDLGVRVDRGEVRSVERRRSGVTVRIGDDQQTAGQVLVTAGAWSDGIGGLPALPITPLRGQMLRLARVDWPFQGCVRGSGFYAARRRGTDLLIGATEEHAGFDASVTAEGLSQLTGWLRRVFPTLAERPVTEIWSGLRPSTPDGMPILERLDDGIWLAAGHHRNGILLAPWTAAVMARWITGSGRPECQDLFTLRRFAGCRASAPRA